MNYFCNVFFTVNLNFYGNIFDMNFKKVPEKCTYSLKFKPYPLVKFSHYSHLLCPVYNKKAPVYMINITIEPS